MSIWTIVADRIVQWGKTEEEERLTGRPESRRTLLEWSEVAVSSIALLILCIVSVLLTCTLIIRALDAGLAPPGQLYWVDADKYQIHVYCHGNRSHDEPTVLFEGGEDAVERGLWKFAEDAVNNGSISRYCFADRPGMAWVSDERIPSTSPWLLLTGLPERHCSISLFSRPSHRSPERGAGARWRGRPVGAGKCRCRLSLLADLLVQAW